MHHHTWLLFEKKNVLGIELRTLCLQGKHLLELCCFTMGMLYSRVVLIRINLSA